MGEKKKKPSARGGYFVIEALRRTNKLGLLPLPRRKYAKNEAANAVKL